MTNFEIVAFLNAHPNYKVVVRDKKGQEHEIVYATIEEAPIIDNTHSPYIPAKLVLLTGY